MLEKQLHEVSSITYPPLAYDSYWIAALSLDKNNTTFNNSNNGNLTKSFEDIIRETADSFDEGISGKIKLTKQEIALVEIMIFGLLLKIMRLKTMNGRKNIN